ncbi:MAG: hypothetical protein F4Y24_04810 [Gemmatimonadetes bacterium]|nr:hypothetical protein [Gemmatimonadota bacterium]MYG22674.1 hypothetical protein [Gemmatimonadota bacterium]MYJ39723.1 hypothetical protein [Gemmatimonadota bacterium]
MGAWSGHARGLGDVTRVRNRLDCRLPRSTVAYFRQHLGARSASGGLTQVAGDSASIHAGKAARRLGMPSGTLSELAPPDPTIDSSDEAGSQLNLVGRLGRALPRRQIVAQGSACLRVIVDDTVLASRLAERVRLLFEVVPRECDEHWRWLEARGGSGDRRNAGDAVHETGNGYCSRRLQDRQWKVLSSGK